MRTGKTMEHEGDYDTNCKWRELDIVIKGFVPEVEDLEIRVRMETIQTTTVLRSVRILRIVLETWEDLLLLRLHWKTISVSWYEELTDHQIPARRPDLIIINNKNKGTCKIVDFAVPADDRIKLKECEKKDKYFDLARQLKKLRNMQVTIIPIVIGAFGTVIKRLLKGLGDLEVGGRVETIQTTALFRTARILRRVLETWGDLLSLRLQWKTIGYRWWEKLKWVNNNNNNNDCFFNSIFLTFCANKGFILTICI